jgi:hypothetical protein
MKEKTVSVAFRSKETGRYLFWVKWTEKEWARIENAAKLDEVPIEEFILNAIERHIKGA